MVDLTRIRAEWNGFPGAPGVSTFYAAGLITPALTAVTSFFGNLQAALPSGVTVQVENAGEVIDSATGQAIAAWSGPTQTVVGGSNSGGYSVASGAVVTWNTGVFVSGRRLRGRTFVVPLGGGQYDATGTLAPGTLDVLDDAAQVIIDSEADFHVFSRTSLQAALISGRSIPDRVAVLRSRRD